MKASEMRYEEKAVICGGSQWKRKKGANVKLLIEKVLFSRSVHQISAAASASKYVSAPSQGRQKRLNMQRRSYNIH